MAAESLARACDQLRDVLLPKLEIKADADGIIDMTNV